MAGELQTTITFANGEQVTSTKLNEIISGASFTEGAVDGTTLLVSIGKLRVGTITANEMGADSITTLAIANASVTTPKIALGAVGTNQMASASVTGEKIAAGAITGINLAAGSVGTASIADASITPSKMSGAQSGAAPVYGLRAFARVAGNGTSERNAGFSTITRASAGVYSMTLQNVPATVPCITATCHAASGFNVSADVQIVSASQFTVRTGFEDTPGQLDASFSLMVVY